MKCKLCKGQKKIMTVNSAGEVDEAPCDCTIKELLVDEDGNYTDYFWELLGYDS